MNSQISSTKEEANSQEISQASKTMEADRDNVIKVCFNWKSASLIQLIICLVEPYQKMVEVRDASSLSSALFSLTSIIPSEK